VVCERSLAVKGRFEAQARDRAAAALAQAVIGDRPLSRLSGRRAVAASEVPILVTGESARKNVLARHVHAVSERRSRPLLEVNCAAIPETLLESELFGHEKGAFTDAKSIKRGVFELAQGGTVVLDEIGELKLDVQAKLLHFLEERRFRRVGGTREIAVDVRVVALTNRACSRWSEKRSGDIFFIASSDRSALCRRGGNTAGLSSRPPASSAGA
jgi:transcriptional regulator with GAF, ATPase, and Fis domain